MKQLLLMIVLTLAGTVGVVVMSPFWGVAVYYLFAVLRPQHLWQWSLPADVPWSQFVAIATIFGGLLTVMGFVPAAVTAKNGTRSSSPRPRLTWAHISLMLFGVWVAVAWVTARNRDVAFDSFVEYLKIFVMFITASLIVHSVRQLWVLMCIAALALGYVAWEINAMYLFQGYLSIYHRGYGGLDNNGAGLMLAMGVPLCLFAWESTTRWWRVIYLLLIPVLIHAVLMSYSRGAMVSLLVVAPLLVFRSRARGLMLVGALGLVWLVPSLAGPEIRARFFTLERYEAQNSAQSRFASWNAGWQLARENPIVGVGLRNSNLFSQQYGADMRNRTIHSQYLQVAADMGLVGLALYLVTLGSVWLSLRRVRRAARKRTDESGRQAHAVACGAETAMLVFLVGALFLSLELFELPYLLLLLGAQLPVVLASAPAAVANPAVARNTAGGDSGDEMIQVPPVVIALPSARARYYARRGAAL